MSQTVEVNTEPLKWPIAPDGYIPNSVIRSWRRKGKDHAEVGMVCWEDIFSLHQVDDFIANDQEDISTRTFLFTPDKEEEEDETDDVKRREEEKEDEENGKDIGQERADEKKEKEEVKMGRIVLVKQSYNIQTKQNQSNTLDDGKMDVEHQRQEVSSTYSSKKTVNFL